MPARAYAPRLSPPRWGLLFCALLILRLMVAALIDAGTVVEKDVDVYATVARNIVAGHGFVAVPGEPMLWRAPIYSYFLAALFGAFGESNEVSVLVAQAMLDACTGMLVFWLGRRLFGPLAGLLAALAFAVYPLSAYYTLRMLPSPVFTLALMTAVASLDVARRGNAATSYLYAGLLIGLTTLVKPVTLFLAPFVGLFMMARSHRRLSGTLLPVALMMAGSLLVISPWTARNWVVTGHFIPVAVGGGFSLWIGNNLVTGGVEEVEGAELAELDRRMRAISASAHGVDPKDQPWQSSTDLGHTVNLTYEADQAFSREALREMASHPIETLGLMARKAYRLWFSIGRLQNRWAQIYVSIAQACLLLLAGWGVVCAIRRKLTTWALLIPVVYLVLVHVVTFSTLRYSMPMIPIVMIFAAGGALDMLVRAAGRLGIALPRRSRELAGGARSESAPF